MVFIPMPVAATTAGAVAMDRELALDSIRALEALVWRYGGCGLECEILAGGELKGRISVTVKVAEQAGGGVVEDG